jgi:hypothetical protein
VLPVLPVSAVKLMTRATCALAVRRTASDPDRSYVHGCSLLARCRPWLAVSHQATDRKSVV